jgi:hypothetical protein
MTPHLTIAYISSRKEPQTHWFVDSLNKQIDEMEKPFDASVIFVEFYADSRKGWFRDAQLSHVYAVSPKPCVWQGEHRLTIENWFAASNARNTALCLAPDGYIAYCDDLSVLCPGWLLNVRQSMAFNGITLGTYRKVKNLVVEKGEIISWDKEWAGGQDSRRHAGSKDGSVPCPGDMLFGCSLVGPVEAFLSVNGWPEMCDGLGFEDVIMGQVLENAGWGFRYNLNMMTLESDEHHHLEPPFRRDCFEKHSGDKGDKGHAVLNMAKGGMKWFPNYYAGGIRKMREEVLAGKPFPVVQIPDRCWHTGKLLSEL